MQEAKRVAIVDEYGALSDELARIAPAIQRHSLLKAEIESWYQKEPADENYVALGTRYEVQIGVREFRRRIVGEGMTRLFTVLGKVKFLSLCTFPLTVLDQVTTIADQGRITKKERTGPRSIKSVALVIEPPVKQDHRRKGPEIASSSRKKAPAAAPDEAVSLDT